MALVPILLNQSQTSDIISNKHNNIKSKLHQILTNQFKTINISNIDHLLQFMETNSKNNCNLSIIIDSFNLINYAKMIKNYPTVKHDEFIQNYTIFNASNFTQMHQQCL